MKKTVFLLASMLLTMGIFAAQAPTAMLKLLVNSQSSISGDNIFMAERSDWSSGNDKGWDGTKQIISGNLQMWVPASFGNLGTMGTNNLENTPITIQTIGDDLYTFSFAQVGGTQISRLKFYDKVADSLTVISTTNTYVVKLPKDTTIVGRFWIVGEYLYYHRDVANGDWATVCFPYKFVDAAGVDKLYSLTAINSAGTKVAIDEVAIGDVVAGKPYIFQSDSTAQEFKYKPENKVLAPDTVGSHGLIGVFADTVFTDQVYLVVNNAITLSAVGSDLVKYRCFIDLSRTPVDDDAFIQQVSGRRIFNIKGTPTELEEMQNAEGRMQNGKRMMDGKLVIIRDGKMFNAQGAQL